MATYELRVHKYDVSKFNIDIGNHTGYDLIITDENGNVTIESIDLTKIDGHVYFDIASSPAEKRIVRDNKGDGIKEIYWCQGDSQELLDEYDVRTNDALLTGDSALRAFQQIKLNAMILNQYSEYIAYDTLTRNCNTSTKYFSDLYLNGMDVFEELPGYYQGNTASFPFVNLDDGVSAGTSNPYILEAQNLTAAIFAGMPEDFDLNNINIEKEEDGSLAVTDGTFRYNLAYHPTSTSISNEKDGAFIVTGNESTSVDNRANSSVIISGTGADYISVSGNYNKVNSGANADTIYISGEHNVANAGSGDDIINIESNKNTINGGVGNDTINVGYFTKRNNNTIDGGAGNDTICGDDRNEILGFGNDALYGEEGNDSLVGGDGDDLLVGGTGDDSLMGGNGDDTYVWKLGDGFDTIYENSGNDKIVFGDGISLDNLSFTRSGSDLTINVNGASDQGINIFGHYLSGWNVETLQFADGSSINVEDAVAQMTQAMSTFGVDHSATSDIAGAVGEDAADMYNLAASDGLYKKAA